MLISAFASHKARYHRLLEEFKLARTKRFSSSSEKNVLQADFFDELFIEPAGELKDQLDDSIDVQSYKRKNHPVRRSLPKDLPHDPQKLALQWKSCRSKSSMKPIQPFLIKLTQINFIKIGQVLPASLFTKNDLAHFNRHKFVKLTIVYYTERLRIDSLMTASHGLISYNAFRILAMILREEGDILKLLKDKIMHRSAFSGMRKPNYLTYAQAIGWLGCFSLRQVRFKKLFLPYG